jgi:anti-sigma regulatory factor (Ser/Thr protein kinase)
MPYYRCAACGVTSYSAARFLSGSTCPTCSAALTDERKLHIVPGAKHDVSYEVLARPEAAAEARHALVGLALPESTRHTLALLVSELVTNSVRHAGLSGSDPIQVDVTNGRADVRATVHDGGPGFTRSSAGSSDPLEPGGQGLVIIDALSDAWGVDCDDDGCTVWCQFALPEAHAPSV